MIENNFIDPKILCVTIGIGYIIIAAFQYCKPSKERRSFKTNAYKIDAEVIGYRSKSGPRRNSNFGSSRRTFYSAIYEYNHPALGHITLMSSIYNEYRAPKNGTIKTIYYNPKYPETYYNNRMDLYSPTLSSLVLGLLFMGVGTACMYA